MFKICDDCDNWAQWRGTVVKDGLIIIKRHLCQEHKDADQTPDIKFTFVGVMLKASE